MEEELLIREFHGSGLPFLGEVSMEALMDYEVEACLACVSTSDRKKSLKDFEDRKK